MNCSFSNSLFLGALIISSLLLNACGGGESSNSGFSLGTPTPGFGATPELGITPTLNPAAESVADIVAIQLVSVTELNDLVVIDTIEDGDIIRSNTLGSTTINIVPLVDDVVGSIKFDLTGPTTINRTENSAPYTLVDQSFNWDTTQNEPVSGDYTLTITPYSQANAQGTVGNVVSIYFSFEQSLDPTPTPTPSLTPTPTPSPDPGPGTTVASDAELKAAIESGTAKVINIAPGNYTLSDMVAGIDRSASPLTIQGQDPLNKPVFLNATQSLKGTRFVTFRNLAFENTGLLVSGDYWFFDPGGNGDNGLTSDIVLDGLDFYAIAPSDLTNPNRVSDYGNMLSSLFKFSNYRTYNYTIQNINAENVFSIGDFRMNGDVLINRLIIDKWYFDGIRILGQGTEGYVDGDRIIANVDILDNIAVYNEIDNASTPHPDNTQVFNSGTSVNNTNPQLTNTLFYHNRFNPGQLRGNSVQSGLSQSREINVGYVENIYGTRGNPHGISLEGGAIGVLIERNALVDVDWGSAVWLRIFRAEGEVAVYNNFFPGRIDTRSDGSFANRDGYELIDSGNIRGEDYASFFTGPSGLTGIEGLVKMFTPVSSSTVGPLNTQGVWRNLPHRPMMAKAPEITTGNSAFTIETIYDPTLWSPDQAGLNADNCLSYDARWSLAGAYDWTIQSDVSAGDKISSVTAGDIKIQTRCVNVAGVGLWSPTTTVSVE